MIRFACPGCGAVYTVKPDKAGKTGSCPKCNTRFQIPEAPVPAEPEPATSSSVQNPSGSTPEPPKRKSSFARDGGSLGDLLSSTSKSSASNKKVNRRNDEDDSEVADDEDDDESYSKSRSGKRRASQRDDRYDDDDDDEDRPRTQKKKSGSRRRSNQNSSKSTYRVVASILSILSALMQLSCGGVMIIAGGVILSQFDKLKAQQNAAQNARMPGIQPAAPPPDLEVLSYIPIVLGVLFILTAFVNFLAGAGGLSRKPFGRIFLIIASFIAVLWCLLNFLGIVGNLISFNCFGLVVNIVLIFFFGAHAFTGFGATFGPGHEREFNQ